MSSTISKDARLNVKLKLADKSRIERAAKLSGHNMTTFILNAALSASDKVMERNQSIIQSKEEAKAFFDIINQPAQVNKNLSRSIRRYKEAFGK